MPLLPFSVVYSIDQVADPYEGKQVSGSSPSGVKPEKVAEALVAQYPHISFNLPSRMNRRDFVRCHSPKYVDDIMSLRIPNGFGTRSASVRDSLPYTSGAMHAACLIATPSKPSAALVSGFHHAGHAKAEGFCTFNGLMVSAMEITHHNPIARVLIIDCDNHYGNGTEEIIQLKRSVHMGRIKQYSLGRYFSIPSHASSYLAMLDPLTGPIAHEIDRWEPSLIIYQAGADVHVDDPFGGVLTEAQMIERDEMVFTIGRSRGVPIAWNLAGGYQVDKDGSINTVVRLHMNTFSAAFRVYQTP